MRESILSVLFCVRNLQTSWVASRTEGLGVGDMREKNKTKHKNTLKTEIKHPEIKKGWFVNADLEREGIFWKDTLGSFTYMTTTVEY